VTSYVEQITYVYLQEHLWKVPISNEYLRFAQQQQQQQQPRNSNDDHITLQGLSLVDNQRDDDGILQNYQQQSNNSIILPFETLHANIQLNCLLLEGFAIHAHIMKTNYNIFFMQSLYPILEKVGSVNASINRTALQVLTDMACYCNYESISDLVLFNSDYLINAVTMQFRHMVFGSAAPAVLSVILKLCDKEIMPIVCDAVDDVFRNLDEYQEDVGDAMLEVLY